MSLRSIYFKALNNNLYEKISPYAFLPLLGLLNAWVAIQSINPFEDFFTGAFLWLAIFPTWFIEMPI